MKDHPDLYTSEEMGLAPSSSAGGGCRGRLSHDVTRGGLTGSDDNGVKNGGEGFGVTGFSGSSSRANYVGVGSSFGCGQAYSGGDVIRRCNCYSMSLDRKCCRHSLTFSAAQPDSGEKIGQNAK